MDRVEAEQHRLGAMLDAGDEIGARTEQQAVGNNLAPARRASVVELEHEPGEQRLAQPSEHGGVGERARADRAGEGLGAKLRLDVDARRRRSASRRLAPIFKRSVRRLAARLAFPAASRARAAFSSSVSSSAVGAAAKLPRPRAASRNRIFGRPRSGRAARTPPRLRPASARRYDVTQDNPRHLVERKALGRGGEFAGEGEDGEGWGEAHGKRCVRN